MKTLLTITTALALSACAYHQPAPQCDFDPTAPLIKQRECKQDDARGNSRDSDRGDRDSVSVSNVGGADSIGGTKRGSGGVKPDTPKPDTPKPGKPKGNASANNGKGGNYAWTGHQDNGKGQGRYKK